jgi:hypothetical protein
MTNTKSFAKSELEILSLTVKDSVVTPFSKEILALCEKFGKSGQSGMSAHFVANALSKSIKSLLLQEPICPITGEKEEWNEISYIVEDGCKKTIYQNKRCSALFKHGEKEQAHYLDAIVWKGEEKYDTFTGSVYIDNIGFDLISSSQFVKFPFEPKTFYIDVVRIPIQKEEAENKKLHYIEDGNGDCYYSVLKSSKQLDSVFKYYTKQNKI